MAKCPKQNARCLECKWELKGTHRCIDGIKCPGCNGPVISELVKE